MKNKKEAYISFRCSKEIKELLEQEADKREWTVSHTVEKILKEYFEEVNKNIFLYRNSQKAVFFLPPITTKNY